MKEEHLEKALVEKPSALERLLANMDLVVCAVAVTILVLVVSGMLGSGNPELPATRVALGAVSEEVVKGIADNRFDSDEGSAQIQDHRDAVSRGWSPLPGSAPEGATEDMYPTMLADALRKGQRNEVVFLPPKGLQAEAGRGVIELRWMEHEDTNVSPRAYAIIRRNDGGAGEQVAEVPGDKLSYRDMKVQAGVRYTYHVVSLTDEAILVNQDRARSAPSDPVTVEAVADFKITLVEAEPEAGRAVFKVEKWQETAWFDKRFTVEPGQEVGALDEGSGVDYATSRILKSIDTKPESRSRVHREVVFDPEGRVSIEGGQVVTEEVTLVENFVVVKAVLEGGGLPSSVLLLEKR